MLIVFVRTPLLHYWYNFTRSNPAYFDRKYKMGVIFPSLFQSINSNYLITVLLFWTKIFLGHVINVLISCMKKRCCDEETSRWPIFSFGLKSLSHLWYFKYFQTSSFDLMVSFTSEDKYADSFLHHSSAFSYTKLRSSRNQVQTLRFVFSSRII
jgi:hypothetical protein